MCTLCLPVPVPVIDGSEERWNLGPRAPPLLMYCFSEIRLQAEQKMYAMLYYNAINSSMS